MAKTLDFNRINRPVLQLVMMDEAKTIIKVSTPGEGLVRELEDTMPELQQVLTDGDQEAIEMCYDLAARLINCNRSFVKVTAAELRDRYGMDLENLLLFFSAYLDFIEEIHAEKN